MSRSRGGAIVLEDVSKAFEAGRIVALAGVSLRVDAGEMVALVGPSGCGKSTLLTLIGALDTPDTGTIEVAGTRLDRLPDPSGYRARTIGFVFQFHHLVPTLSAEENVQLPMVGRRVPRRERVARARQLIRDVGLEGRAGSAPATLSGGERQRVAIARALVNEPPVVLADEPTGALDAETGATILELLRHACDARGTTILLATNDDRAALAADRVLHLRDGRLGADARAVGTLPTAEPGREPGAVRGGV